MATTSVSLGEHWETFIQNKIASGSYTSVSEVLREGLRSLERSDQERLVKLRGLLMPGMEQAQRGEFVENFSIEHLIQALDKNTHV